MFGSKPGLPNNSPQKNTKSFANCQTPTPQTTTQGSRQSETKRKILLASGKAKMNVVHPQNNRKKKSSFFSRLTKRQKTTKQILSSSTDQLAMDQIPLNKEAANFSQKGSIPVMSVADSTPPSLQSLSSSQSSMDTQSNHEKMHETRDSSSSSSKSPKSLYAPCDHKFADLDDEFMEIRVNRWREEAKTFADLESSAQFSMSMDVDERRNVAGNKAVIQRQAEKLEAKEVAATSTNNMHGPLDTTSDSMPLPVLSSKQKEMVEPTLFELDSSLLSELSAINLVEESFSDEESQESHDGTHSDCDVETSDLPEEEDDDDAEEFQEELDGEDVGTEDEEELAEQTSGAFQLFSFDYLQERLSCISCV